MRVTVGAIRAIVRQEAGRLNEGEEGEFAEEGEEFEEEELVSDTPEDAKAMTDPALILKLRTELGAALENVKDQWNDEIWANIQQVITAWAQGAQQGRVATRRLNQVLSDEGSSKSSGYAAGKASDADLDEGSAQTSGYSDGKGSDPGARGN